MIQKSFFLEHEGRGTLYLVATPIGNLEDMTYRAVRILREVTWIAAEDTRQTRKLLNHFEIETRLVSYHDHNKENSGRELIRLLAEGESVALVSDAGTPVISDPGYELVVQAIDEGIPVVPIPGANAAINALIGSGVSTGQFSFFGFLPRDKKTLESTLEGLGRYETTMIFYESPYRVDKTLESMLKVWGDRPAALVRELTKKYEEWVRGTLSECLQHVTDQGTKGEYCIVVSGADPDLARDNEEKWWKEFDMKQHVDQYVEQGLSAKDAIKRTAEDRSIPKREVYQYYHQIT